jgi:subtilisin
MTNRAALLTLCVAVISVLALASSASAREIPGQYIVVLNDGVDAGDVSSEHGRDAGAGILHRYSHAIDGYAARLSAAGLARVKADPRVRLVVPDEEGMAAAAQTSPTGVRRIDSFASSAFMSAGTLSTTSVAVDADIAVFDSGIQTNHPDLNVAGGVNCLGAKSKSNDGTIGDQNGHGTHVAGIIGAKDDANGVVGTVPGARLWSVRIGDSATITTTSAQLCGIDWVTANGAANGIRVVNASYGLLAEYDDGNCGYTAGDVLHQAICRSAQAGILWVFATGNGNGDFHIIPGADYDEVLAVTAAADSNGAPNVPSTKSFTCTAIGQKKASPSQIDDKHASFSNYAVRASDQAHTIAGPGACIWSTWKGSTYGYNSGTSMAAPHVTAVAALCFEYGHCTGTPAETIQKLRADAESYNRANPGYGFTGDPLRPITGRYYGFLVRAGLY